MKSWPILMLRITQLLFIMIMQSRADLAFSAKTPIKIVTGEKYGSMIQFEKADGGPLTDFVRKIFQDMGYAPGFDFLPWKRAYADSLNTMYAASFPWFRNSEREKEFFFSEPLLSMSIVGVVGSSSSIQKLDFETMKNLRSCDLLSGKEYKLMIERSQVKMVYVQEIKQCHQMLLNERIDFLFMNREIAEKSLNLGIKIVPDVLNYNLGLHLIVSRRLKNGKALVEQFNQTMKKLLLAKTITTPIPEQSIAEPAKKSP